ncbi:MAG TPA: energy transducer TonB [Bacteroidota bacterium]|nr:energy transducer TonB [Bacteroidota bacterium]
MKPRTEQVAAVTEAIEYGRPELKKVLQRNYVRGMLISFAVHFALLGTYYLAQYLGEDDENIPTVSVRILKYSDLGPPPSIAATPPPPAIGVTAAVKPSVGVPVPVPDAEASAEQTLATQAELSQAPSPALEQGLGEGGEVQVQQDIVISPEDEPGMDEFIPVEKQPQIVKRVIPKYPDMALRAGLEGTVWVKILVDKDGLPKKAVVIKSTAELFNEAAIEAAMKFVFTPAVMNNGPVKVWVSIPFRFLLKDAQSSS